MEDFIIYMDRQKRKAVLKVEMLITNPDLGVRTAYKTCGYFV